MIRKPCCSRFSLHKFVHLKFFWTQFKNVHLGGPCSSRPCISRPYCTLHCWAPSRWQSPHGEIFAVKPFWPNEIYVKMVGAKCARDCCSGRLFRKVWIQFLLPNKLFYTHTCKVYFCAQISPQCDQKSYEFTFEDLLSFKIGNYFLHFHISNMYTRVAKVMAIHNDLLTQWSPI